MRFGLDTSVVLRLVSGQPKSQATAALARLERAAREGDKAVVSDLVILEAYHALQFHYGLSRTEARDLLLGLLTSDLAEPQSAEVLMVLRSTGGPGVVDRMIQKGYSGHGATTLTFDRRMATLPGVERIS